CTHPLAQLISFRRVLGCQTGFPEIRVARSEQPISHSEIRVDGDGPLKEGDGGGEVVFYHHGPLSKAVRLKGFERWRCGLLNRRIEFLHRVERLTKLVAHSRSHSSQCIEHVALVARLSFRARERCPV